MHSPEIEAKEIKEELTEVLKELKSKQEEISEEGKRRKPIEKDSDAKAFDGKEKIDSSYSESKQAEDIEGKNADLQSLKKSKQFQALSNSTKALAAYQVVSKQMSDLVGGYTALIEKDLHRAQKMVAEIARIRAMQKVLLTKLFGKLPEEIEDKEVIEELEEFLKE